MKKMIVTGGSGFIGSNLVNFLIQKKYFVINIDKLTIQLYEDTSDTLYDCQNNDNSFEFELTILNKHV